MSVIGILRRVVEALNVLVFAAFTGVVLLQVLFRYVINDSIPWAEEFSRYALLWSVLLGAAAVSDQDRHLRVDVLDRYVGLRARRVLRVLVHLLSIAFLAILCWQGLALVGRVTLAHSPALQAPMSLVYAAMPIGAALMGVFTLVAIKRLLTGEQLHRIIPEADEALA